MTFEERLADAFATVDDFEPSVDLWARVNRSIEEDRAHRKRLRSTMGMIAVALILLIGAGWLALFETTAGRLAVEWRALEAIETIALVLLIVTLGPAVRRFGDGYAAIIFKSNEATGERFIRLLDVSYYLLFAGYVLVSAGFEQPIESTLTLGDQLGTTMARIGGLLLVMGVLHGTTFIVLPLVGLVFTATWHHRPLPRWINAVLVLAGVAVALAVIFQVIIVLSLGAGS